MADKYHIYCRHGMNKPVSNVHLCVEHYMDKPNVLLMYAPEGWAIDASMSCEYDNDLELWVRCPECFEKEKEKESK